MKRLIMVLVLVISAAFISGCAEIGPQEGGVRTNYIGLDKGFGQSAWLKQGIAPTALQPGLYLNIPHITEVHAYPVNEQQYFMYKDAKDGRDDVSFKTKDGQKAWIDVTVRYRLIFDKLPTFHREYGDSYIENVLRPTVRSLVNNKLGEYSANEIYDGATRQAVAAKIRNLINEGYDNQRGTKEIGLEIEDILFRRFEFTDEYQAAIEMKRIASEQHLAALEQAKRKEAEASGDKMATIERAKGEAQKIKLEADAKLYAKLKEAEGIEAAGLANAKAQAKLAEALGGGDEVVRMEFARHLAKSFQVWGIPTGDKSNSVMDLSGVFGTMFPKTTPAKTTVNK